MTLLDGGRAECPPPHRTPLPILAHPGFADGLLDFSEELQLLFSIVQMALQELTPDDTYSAWKHRAGLGGEGEKPGPSLSPP